MAQTDAHSLKDSKDADEGALGQRTAHPGSAALQEKAAIDAGLTGDKVAHNDIATSPLGTDDEAGGGAPAPVQFPSPETSSETKARDPNWSNERAPPASWLWLVAALVAAAALGALLFGALGRS
jgi:hypothetical protein